MKKLLLTSISMFGMITLNILWSQSSLTLDGTDDYILGTNDASLDLSEGTLEAWIKTGGAGIGYRGIIVKQGAYGLYLYNNVLTAFDYFGGGAVSTPFLMNDNSWHHVAFTFDGTNSNFYIDGALAHSAGYVSGSSIKAISVGAGDELGGQHFLGQIDQVRIWSVVRTEEEIAENYKKCMSGSEANLVMNWHFEEGSGSSVTADFTPNNNGGALTNMDVNTSWTVGYSCHQFNTYGFSMTNNVGECEVFPTWNFTGSDLNTEYILIDDTDSSFIDGPFQGTGSGLNGYLLSQSLSVDVSVMGEIHENSGALRFNGINNYLFGSGSALPSQGTDQFTIEAWLRPESIASTPQTIISQNEFNSQGEYEVFLDTLGKINLAFYTNIGADTITSSSILGLNEWTHVSIAVGIGSALLYVNGLLENGIAYSGGMSGASLSYTVVGARSMSFDQNFHGSIDELRIWDSKRTNQEVFFDHQISSPNSTPGLFRKFSFEQNSNTALDSTDFSLLGFSTGMNSSAWDVRKVLEAKEKVSGPESIVISPLSLPSHSLLEDSLCTINFGTSLDLISTLLNVDYELWDETNDTLIDGPYNGNGANITFNIPSISSGINISVKAQKMREDFYLDFDGIDDQVSVSNANTQVDNFTMEGWFYSESPSTGSVQFLMYKGNPSVSGYGLLLDTSGEIVVLLGGITVLNSGYIMPANTWTHVAITRTAGMWTMLVDGIDQGLSSGATPAGQPNFISIGGYSADYFDGRMNEIRIWDTPRTAAQVLNYKDSCIQDLTELSLYLPLNNYSQNMTILNFGNGEDATMYNMDPNTDYGIPSQKIICPVCDASANIDSIFVADSIAINSTIMNVSCFGLTDGLIDLSITGGFAPFQYYWDIDGTGDFDDNQDISGLDSGSYQIIVQDVKNCIDSAQLVIEEPLPLSLSGSTTNEQFGSDGEIDLTVSGGTTPYNYQWDDQSNSTSEDLTNLDPGSYQVVVVDDNGCSDSLTLTIDSELGISNENFNIELYPNPSKDFVFFESPFENLSYQILDLTGKTLIENQHSSGSDQVDVSSLAAGSYLMIFQIQNQEFKKMLIVH